MPSFKQLENMHDEYIIHSPLSQSTVELLTAVSEASGKTSKALLFSTGKYSTLGQFSLKKYVKDLL